MTCAYCCIQKREKKYENTKYIYEYTGKNLFRTRVANGGVDDGGSNVKKKSQFPAH